MFHCLVDVCCLHLTYHLAFLHTAHSFDTMSIPRGSRSRSREPMSSAAASSLDHEDTDQDLPGHAHVETHMVHFANHHTLVLPAVTHVDRPQDVQARWHGWFDHLVDQQGYRQPPLLTSTQPLAHRDLYHFFDLNAHLPPYLRHGLCTDLLNRWNLLSETDEDPGDDWAETMDGQRVTWYCDELEPVPIRSLIWPPYFNEFPILIDFNLFGLAYGWFLTQHARVPPLAIFHNDLNGWHPHNFLHTPAATINRQFHHIQPLRPSRVFTPFQGRYTTWSDLRSLVIDHIQIAWDIDLAPIDIYMYLDMGGHQPIEPGDDDTLAWLLLGHFPIWPQINPLMVFVTVTAGITPLHNIFAADPHAE